MKEGLSKAELVGFAVCGADKKFHNAKAEIAGNAVIVSCDAVPAIVAVRATAGRIIPSATCSIAKACPRRRFARMISRG